MRKKTLCLVGGGLCLVLLAVQAWNAEAEDWTLKVSVDGARVHLRPDPSSPTASAAAKGTILKSYARVGDWYRVIIEPGKEGLLVIGYIPSSAVDVVEKSQAEPDFWKQVSGEYRGFGISLNLGGGYQLFSGGTITSGTSGIFDQIVDMASDSGVITEDINPKSLHAGTSMVGDVVYSFNRRTGLGLRLEYLHARSSSILRYNLGDPYRTYSTWSTPNATVFVIRPGFYYDHPLNRRLTLAVNGGPALYLVTFEYGHEFIGSQGINTLSLKTKAHGFGFQGGLGLEMRLNRRAAIFLEAQGRLGKISAFKGDETYYRTWNLQAWTVKTKGFLYYLEEGEHPGLAVLEEESAGKLNCRRATLNLGGVNFAAGLRVRF
ncbi:MAG: hypothetical protein MUQ00_15305 [Candidatus Aminicenantes bacterium]|nr:hypothetical protein [Candidatus Aminicenantes bacterium]